MISTKISLQTPFYHQKCSVMQCEALGDSLVTGCMLCSTNKTSACQQKGRQFKPTGANLLDLWVDIDLILLASTSSILIETVVELSFVYSFILWLTHAIDNASVRIYIMFVVVHHCLSSGVEFLVPSFGFYCSLCEEHCRDSGGARKHVLGDEHYKEYIVSTQWAHCGIKLLTYYDTKHCIALIVLCFTSTQSIEY